VKLYYSVNQDKVSAAQQLRVAAQQLNQKRTPSSHKRRSVSPRLNSNNISNVSAKGNTPTTRTTTKHPKKQKLLPKPNGPGRNSVNNLAEAQRFRMQEKIQREWDQKSAADTRKAMVESKLLQQQLDLTESFQKEQQQKDDAHLEKVIAKELEMQMLREQNKAWVSSYCTLCSVPPRALPHASLTYMHRK
jgi:hypothetical protein